MTYEIGIDIGNGPDVCIEERYIKSTPEFPKGSYLHKVGGRVVMATGFYEKEYPGHPSPYWHGGPPFVMIDWDAE